MESNLPIEMVVDFAILVLLIEKKQKSLRKKKLMRKNRDSQGVLTMATGGTLMSLRLVKGGSAPNERIEALYYISLLTHC